MIKKSIITLSAVAALATNSFGASNVGLKLSSLEETLAKQAIQISKLEAKLKKVDKLSKKIKKNKKAITAVKIHDAYDNIKFGIDMRSGADFINVTDNNGSYFHDAAGTSKSNEIYTNKIDLTMMSSPDDKITFRGKFGVYNVWGGHPGNHDSSYKVWQRDSKPHDNIFKLKEAYMLYTTEYDVKYSIGRRKGTEGFLANYRNNTKSPNSPLAHVTNVEIDALMIRFGETFTKATGSFMKFLYGRAHDPASGVNSMYLNDGYKYPDGLSEGNATSKFQDQEVDIVGLIGNIYSDGTYTLMGQYMAILNTKGFKDIDLNGEYNKGTDIKSAASGKAIVSALSLEIAGLDMINEDSDFLADTVLFASYAQTEYRPHDGYLLLGSKDNKVGNSLWVGANFPDMITDDGRLGIEYNQGSKNWTPFTWAEDTLIGSKIAVRGSATEVYWNTKIGGFDNLTAQLRYTYVQHDFTPNQFCRGWEKSEAVDIVAEDIHFSVRYRY